MTPIQKKIAWAVVLTAGVVLVGGVAVAASGGGSSGALPPPAAPYATDDDVAAVVDKALAIETDPDLLRQLARAMMILPYWNPLHNKIGPLQARADALEAGKPQLAQPISGGPLTLAQALLAARNG